MSSPPSSSSSSSSSSSASPTCEIRAVLTPLNGRTFTTALSWFPTTTLSALDFEFELRDVAWQNEQDTLFYARYEIGGAVVRDDVENRRLRAQKRMEYVLEYAPGEMVRVMDGRRRVEWDGDGMGFVEREDEEEKAQELGDGVQAEMGDDADRAEVHDKSGGDGEGGTDAACKMWYTDAKGQDVHHETSYTLARWCTVELREALAPMSVQHAVVVSPLTLLTTSPLQHETHQTGQIGSRR
ncbi:hypothetical protein CC86DRAFT_378854 [Ophiobolus disseminans]|uniref:Uncharacterized protein n=1 Tax=Ophiobolus disseminans TaxID=1469910 RepID=A0A6A7AD33_9PLEO|nr:hypothetical protein CC86DRAFT_378854 [Ophiobolus disseminans]